MVYVGFAEADITPKPGSESPGGMVKRKVQEVHDPLKVVAMAIRSGDRTVALVGVDAIMMPAGVTAEARAIVEREAKVPGDCVLVGASHTHSGGPISDVFESESDPAYKTMVAARIAEAVVGACGRLHGAEVGVGSGHEPSLSFNRRFLMRDGSQVTHPGKGNRDIVRPAGPIDPEVGVLAARWPNGELMGLFVNFACHLTIGNGPGFSADYVYFLRESLRRHYKNPALPVGFLLGAAGDVTQVDNLRPGREFGPEWSSIFGMGLAAEVAQAVGRMAWSGEAEVRALRTVVPIPIRELHEEPKAPAIGLGSGAVAERVYAVERDRIAEQRRERPIVPCEVQAIRVGDLGIATNGAEFFCQLGLDIKAASPFPKTWLVSLANDNLGYVPTASAFYAGGYEPRTARSSRLGPGAGQALVVGAIGALRRVAPGSK